MVPHYQLRPLSPAEAQRWDELIAPYPGRQLFHRRAWLDYLAAGQKAEIRLWAILEGKRTAGYFCGGVVRKGPFRILGSPLKGWGTNFMGPVTNGYVDQRRLFEALDDLARQENWAMLELEHPMLAESALQEAGFEAVTSWTYWITLTPENPDLMWQGLESICRNRIRKAIKSGLTVEDTDDLVVADEFNELYADMMKRKNLMPSFSHECPRLLVRHLKATGGLLALRVRDNAGRLLAVGLFPHDDETIYFWGGTSRQEGRELCPNEFLHWSAMRLAAERGLRRYDMCGYGRFKKKFNGELITLKRWHKCYWRSARWARGAYQFYFQKRIRLVSWWERIVNGRIGT